jgi:hypothetical protein
MASSVTDTSVCKTPTATTDDSDMSLQLPENAFAYVALTHLHPTVIMETRRESLFNHRRRVHLAKLTTAPFRPISTINFDLPNELDPTRLTSLSREALVEFDAFSRGIANEALRRKPENCIIGDFTNEEI